MRNPNAKKYVPFSEEWDKIAYNIAVAHAPRIYPCGKCGYPVVSGFCCGNCGDGNPQQTLEQERAEEERYAKNCKCSDYQIENFGCKCGN